MRSRHKTQNIDMKGGHLCRTTNFNILAFFKVVASGQIFPHFRGAKICIYIYICKTLLRYVNYLLQIFKNQLKIS